MFTDAIEFNAEGEYYDVPEVGQWVTVDELDTFAKECMTRPAPGSGFACWDSNIFYTHCIGFATSDMGEIIDESNWATVVPVIESYAENEQNQHGDADDAWAYRSYISGFGGTNALVVRVWVDDECMEYTDAFVVCLAIKKALQDYPIFDESDYSDREYEAQMEAFGEVVSDARNELDDQDDHDAIMDMILEGDEYYDLWNGEWYAERELIALYNETREKYYLTKAIEQGFAQLEGQTEIEMSIDSEESND